MSVQPRISFPPFTAFSHLIPGPNCHTVCLLPFPSRLKEVARHCSASNITELERPIDHCIKQRNEIRLGLPSKGRMASETLDLLEIFAFDIFSPHIHPSTKDCQLSVKQKNPRQYVAVIPQLPNVEVWFQRPKDIVRKLLFGDLDLGIVGLDTVMEYGQGSDDLVMVHDALAFGDCRLSLAVPTNGIFENVNSFLEMSRMPEWTVDTPLRIATGFCYLGEKFFSENGMKYISFSVGDGALEAAPAMGSADAVLDLVGSGTTLKENHLKEIEGGIVMESQAVLVGSRKSLLQERRSPLLITREILERLEAHLRAAGQFTVTANMRGSSAEQVAARVLSQPSLSGLEGPTVSPVFCRCSQPSSDHHRDDRNGSELSSSSRCSIDYYAVVICVPKRALYKSVQQLRAIGGSGVLVSPLTYIFEEESPRWRTLLSTLNMSL